MKRLFLTTALLAAVGAGPAAATTINWDFGATQADLGPVATFNAAGGGNLVAKGFTSTDSSTDIFRKLGGGDENGLGLTNDPSGDNEISGGNFILLNVDGALADRVGAFDFSMGSTTQGEQWTVYGSDNGSPFSLTKIISGTDEGIHSLGNTIYDNYIFAYTGPGGGQAGGDNVLLDSFAGTAGAVPEPSTWVMMGAGFALLAGLGLRKRRVPRFAV